MTQLLLSIALGSPSPLCSTFSPPPFFSRLKVSLSQSPASCSHSFLFVRVLSGFSLLCSDHFSSSFHTYFYQLDIFPQFSALLSSIISRPFFYFFQPCKVRPLSSLHPLNLSLILPLNSFHPISLHLFPSSCGRG